MRSPIITQVKSLLLLTISLSAAIFIKPAPPLIAQTPIPQPTDAPLELSLLAPDAPKKGVVTANTISQKHLTVPSLWWAKEQFGGKLLDNWLAYPSQGTTTPRVDLIVNRQIWSLLDYVERYDFVNSLGSVARDYGYNVRVFNYQQELLATYTCNFNIQPSLCSMDNLDATGRARLSGSKRQF